MAMYRIWRGGCLHRREGKRHDSSRGRNGRSVGFTRVRPDTQDVRRWTHVTKRDRSVKRSNGLKTLFGGSRPLARLLLDLHSNFGRRLQRCLNRWLAPFIDRLLTDEGLRVRFVFDRIETLAELSLRGLDLTSAEVDLFYRTDARLWFWGETFVGALKH
jgi:hypothetical protein